MTEADLYARLLEGVFLISVVTALALLFLSAPYGRHARGGWGPMMDTRFAWVVMESPAVLGFLAIYFAGAHALELAPLALLAMWQAHYVQRTFIFPFKLRPGGRTPVSVVAMGFFFNIVNAYLNARWLSELGSYDTSWLWSPAFIIGLILFVTGYRINRWADRVLADLRKPGETGYKIPRGGLYELISCPNYFGELLEWTGFAIAAGSLAGWSFVVFTAANLVPRAITHHRWYRGKFPDYPPARKAVIPFVL
jgi:protein-S-isoprenylcysteine O-methyltransferase Ste14